MDISIFPLFHVYLEIVECVVCIQPVPGLMSFIGCMMILPQYSGSQLGWSFALALTSACLVLLITVLLCYAGCKDMKDEGGESDGGVVVAVSHFSVVHIVHHYYSHD